ncbi:MAG: ATP-binding cassette domain-containing protein [Proteobacteria bacterium]|nr:ATP-binding cassette domain-containing protein [Pseudomonadota bacterium]
MPLEAKDLSFRYKKSRWILDRVHLELQPGQVLGISGPSGCGKSTLARILAGYEKPLAGGVTLGGRPLPQKGFNPVQLISQHPEKAVNPRWRMHRTLNEGFRPDDIVLSSLGIEKKWLKRWPNELSGGELQRFCLARALGPQTRFVIADEISTMLDPVTQAQIWSVLLDSVKKRNMGLLAISHDKNLLMRISSMIIIWEDMMMGS